MRYSDFQRIKLEQERRLFLENKRSSNPYDEMKVRFLNDSVNKQSG